MLVNRILINGSAYWAETLLGRHPSNGNRHIIFSVAMHNDYEYKGLLRPALIFKCKIIIKLFDM